MLLTSVLSNSNTFRSRSTGNACPDGSEEQNIGTTLGPATDRDNNLEKSLLLVQMLFD